MDSVNRNYYYSGADSGFFVCGGGGDRRLLFADENVIRMFGCSSFSELQMLTKKCLLGMIHPDDRNKIEANVLELADGQNRKHVCLRLRLRDRKGGCFLAELFCHVARSTDEYDLVFDATQKEDIDKKDDSVIAKQEDEKVNSAVAKQEDEKVSRTTDRKSGTLIYVFISLIEKDDFLEALSQDYCSCASSCPANGMKEDVDILTGLPDITAFYKASEDMLTKAREGNGSPSCVVVFDIVGLKELNYDLGRDEGDARINALAKAIREHMPKGSLFFRGHEAELLAVCLNMSEESIKDNIMSVVNSCKSRVLFGIGSVFVKGNVSHYIEGAATFLQALSVARYALMVKKLLDPESAHSQIMTSLIRALEEVDSDTEEHVQRTQKMGVALGQRIGLPDAQLTSLRLLCLLHDIGKITIPLEILNKPGRLTNEEWAVLRTHAEKGFQIASATEQLRPMAEIILHHHERWDGKGYPSGLSREEIPVLSRVISIVDAYDAMVNDRAYRSALLPDTAKAEIRDNLGTQFDPYLASEFLKMLDEDPTLSIGVKTGADEVRVFKKKYAITEHNHGNTSPVHYTKYKLDIDDRIIEIDSFFEEMTGYSKEDVVGKMSQFDLIPKEDLEQYLVEVGNQFVKGDIAYLHHRIQRKDGTIIKVICNGERYFDSSVRAFRSTILVFEV